MNSIPWIKHFKSYTEGGYVGELENLERMELVISEYEEHFGIPFTKAKTEGTLTSRGDSVSVRNVKSLAICKYLPGIPSLKIGNKEFACRFGTDKAAGRRRIREIYSYEGDDRKKKMAPSIKVDCPAKLVVHEYLCLPDFNLNAKSTHHARNLRKEARKLLSKGIGERRLIIILPRLEKHENHPTDDTILSKNRIHPKVKEFISTLADKGLKRLTEEQEDLEIKQMKVGVLRIEAVDLRKAPRYREKQIIELDSTNMTKETFDEMSIDCEDMNAMDIEVIEDEVKTKEERPDKLAKLVENLNRLIRVANTMPDQHLDKCIQTVQDTAQYFEDLKDNNFENDTQNILISKKDYENLKRKCDEYSEEIVMKRLRMCHASSQTGQKSLNNDERTRRALASLHRKKVLKNTETVIEIDESELGNLIGCDGSDEMINRFILETQAEKKALKLASSKKLFPKSLDSKNVQGEEGFQPQQTSVVVPQINIQNSYKIIGGPYTMNNAPTFPFNPNLTLTLQ
ncbi:DgyrCDS6024 [Dimorphilus gyrociliatus]|uniref:DgyrCDS6024 n=1 Tax=Dimorphilus gyrociliatus TaxID=2664684 RepID=A0A7I8VP35_9ANNE|nr:DgyrCDS6024 [Dimorphilus gyrociliatus]